jgi:1-acyl-sn-glycerol-3-phosphate acyltransferase
VSLALWVRTAAVGGFWYVVLVGLSYVVPMARLRRLAQRGFRAFVEAAGADVRIVGADRLDPGATYLYLGNHVSLFDPFFFVVAAPQWVVALEKRPNFKIPVYGRLITRWGNIPIDRDDLQGALAALKEVVAALQRGQSVCVMPEGTRTRDGEVGEYKVGPFHAAIEAGVTVVPFAFRGLTKFHRVGTWRLRPGIVEVVFTPPIDARQFRKDDIATFSDLVRRQILDALDDSPISGGGAREGDAEAALRA